MSSLRYCGAYLRHYQDKIQCITDHSLDLFLHIDLQDVLFQIDVFQLANQKIRLMDMVRK